MSDGRAADLLRIGAAIEQDARGHAVLAPECQQEVLGADVVVTQAQRLVQRKVQDVLGAWVNGI